MKGVAYLAKFKVQLQEMENEPMNEAAFVIVVIKLTKSKCEEPCEGRLSSTVPRGRVGEIPSTYSTRNMQ